ncbi:MAG: hypothetical protein EXR76_16610 [Myxococcales bacterium]|nr:hypothetical protein [Myxococcales bacterium]
MATPLQTVKNQFGSKEALVEKLVPLLARADGESDKAFVERLLRVPNAKLIRLLARESKVRDKFGGKSALVDTLAGLRAAGGKIDGDWKKRATEFSTGKLLSLHGPLAKKAPSAKK